MSLQAGLLRLWNAALQKEGETVVQGSAALGKRDREGKKGIATVVIVGESNCPKGMWDKKSQGPETVLNTLINSRGRGGPTKFSPGWSGSRGSNGKAGGEQKWGKFSRLKVPRTQKRK